MAIAPSKDLASSIPDILKALLNIPSATPGLEPPTVTPGSSSPTPVPPVIQQQLPGQAPQPGAVAPNSAIPNLPPSAPPVKPMLAPPGQRTSDNGFFAAASPAPGEPYKPLTVPDKISRVISTVGDVANQLADKYAAPIDQPILLERKRLALEQQGQNSRLQTEALERQRMQQQIGGYRTPEQEEALKYKYNPHTVANPATGQIYERNPDHGTYIPAQIEQAAGITPSSSSGGALPGQLLSPAAERYKVNTLGERPVNVEDTYTKKTFRPIVTKVKGKNTYSFPTGTPQEVIDAWGSSMSAHDLSRQEKLEDSDRMLQREMAMLGARTQASLNKPTADEQRRADLAENLNENLNALQDILQRRPDLFGPGAGRWTSIKGFIGSDDPDIGAVMTIKHQIGMAQVSAHGMRSAMGVGAAAHSILNNFNSEPSMMQGAIDAARNSVETFVGDVNRKATKSGYSGQFMTIPKPPPKPIPAPPKGFKVINQ